MKWQEKTGGKLQFFDDNSPRKAKKGHKWPFLAHWQPPMVHPLPQNIISDHVYLILVDRHEMAKEISR